MQEVPGMCTHGKMDTIYSPYRHFIAVPHCRLLIYCHFHKNSRSFLHAHTHTHRSHALARSVSVHNDTLALFE